MGLPLRTGLLAIVLATSLVPLAGLGVMQARESARASEALEASSFERAALASAVRADLAARQGDDPLAAAHQGVPPGARTYLLARDGAWQGSDGSAGSAPELARLVGDRLSGHATATDPGSGADARLAWARAPNVDGVILLSAAPQPPTWVTPVLLSFMGLLLGGVVLVATSLTRRVVDPVARLEAASVRLAEGDWSIRAPIEGSREVESLARSFNRMADALQAQTAELDRLVRDRTRSLAESEADVERLNFTLAHELREPLRSMGTLATHALGDESAEEARHVLGMLARRIAQLERILLDLMRYEDLAHRDAPMGPLDLRRVAEEAAATVRSQEGPLNVDVGPLPEVRGNPELLAAAFEEALRNAVQHAGAGSRVVLASRVADGRAEVTVDDEGPGVPADRREDAFHLFQRLRPDSPGTGVGLAIVQRVAARHDGAARLEEAPGGGTRLVLDLPLAGPVERAPPPETPPSRRF